MMRTLSLTSVLLLFAAAAQAQDKQADTAQGKKPQDKKKIAYLTPEAAGPDFNVQGEYKGRVHGDDGVVLGFQVIALGDGQFEAWAYPGGLPGAGWNGELRVKATGSTTDGVTILNAEQGSVEIRDGAATVYDLENNQIGELVKVTRKSPTLGAEPPSGAVVLFNGKSADAFHNGKLTKDGLLQQGVTSKETFGSFRLHMEFMLSFMPYARGQQRSNSGCYMQGRYETQILDSFGLTGEHNECGGIYSVRKPNVNMCLPPLSWQTYDVEFQQAKFDDAGKKTGNARMTVRLNGVVIHENVEVDHATTAHRLKEGPEPGPIYIQDHSNPVRFRNIWVERIPAAESASKSDG